MTTREKAVWASALLFLIGGIPWIAASWVISDHAPPHPELGLLALGAVAVGGLSAALLLLPFRPLAVLGGLYALAIAISVLLGEWRDPTPWTKALLLLGAFACLGGPVVALVTGWRLWKEPGSPWRYPGAVAALVYAVLAAGMLLRKAP